MEKGGFGSLGKLSGGVEAGEHGKLEEGLRCLGSSFPY